MRLPREENWHDEQVACNLLIIVCVCMFVCMYEGAFITFIMMWNWETSSSSNTKKNVCEERAKDQMAIFAFAEDWSDKIVSSHCNINNNKWSFASSTVLSMNISYKSCIDNILYALMKYSNYQSLYNGHGMIFWNLTIAIERAFDG